ncbi:hypothetical protein PRUB_b0453 [Pseudoalteromonas rubra]|uniref:Orphan protein n=1 Tax=Pseudoalteromonas rubra TaxID=43658 RepID=A0A8T0C1T7_9GAMM|nr:hypothetical protein [Pseudoalteromonas rubra]KAF7781287.1 hypothetical protein PRUB_b0453 [Pseudoalteromonas rubra]
MKNALLVSLLSLASTTALANATPSVSQTEQAPTRAGYSSVDEVIEYGRQYQEIKGQLLDTGYELQSCNQHVLNYFVQPASTVYLYAQAECTFSRSVGGDYSLETDYAMVKIDVEYHQFNQLFHEGTVNVNYVTVY